MTIGPAGTPPALDIRREPLPCKVCGASSLLDGVVDFNKSWSELQGVSLPLRGASVYYHGCPDCGVVFTVASIVGRRRTFRDIFITMATPRSIQIYEEARPVSNALSVASLPLVARICAFSTTAGAMDVSGALPPLRGWFSRRSSPATPRA
jgi:hypothetical protein